MKAGQSQVSNWVRNRCREILMGRKKLFYFCKVGNIINQFIFIDCNRLLINLSSGNKAGTTILMVERVIQCRAKLAHIEGLLNMVEQKFRTWMFSSFNKV